MTSSYVVCLYGCMESHVSPSVKSCNSYAVTVSRCSRFVQIRIQWFTFSV